MTRKVGADTYVREPFQGKSRQLKDLLKQLGPNDRIAVPLFRGKRGVEWQNMTADEFAAFWRQYSLRGTARTEKGSRRIYHDLGKVVQIFRIEGPSAREYSGDEDEMDI